MQRLQDIARDGQAMKTLVGLTNVFESIASIRINQVKNQVLQSKQFFGELWQIYQQIRVDEKFHFGRADSAAKVIDKTLMIIITAEGGFSGDIDERLINLLLQSYDPAKNDIIVIGHHGAVRLAHLDVHFKKYYKLPSKDRDINVGPIVGEIQKYKNTVVYYQTYVSLMVQDVKRIELSNAVAEAGQGVSLGAQEISEKTYIFEPSTFAVVDHIERSMLHIALSQVILESKLAQYASRFRAMSSAHDKATASFNDIRTRFNQARRSQKDERLKETINGMRSVAKA